MKRAINQDLVREIARSRSRFLSILIMVGLASMFLCGLRSTMPDMQLSADQLYDAQHLMDLRVMSTLGLVEDDVTALEQVPGIAAAEGSYTLDAILQGPQNEYSVKLHTLSERINTPRLLEGRLPENAQECVLEGRFVGDQRFQIGDVVTLAETDSIDGKLAQRSYTLVGVVQMPLYMGTGRGTSTLGDGSVDGFMLLHPDAFTMDYYTQIDLLAESTEQLLCYGEEYEQRLDALSDAVRPVGEAQVALRHDTIEADALAEVADAEKELRDGEATLASEEADARAELADARRELDEGWDAYHEGCETYEREIADAEQQLSDAKQKLLDGEQELADGERELAANRTKLLEQQTEVNTQLVDAETQLAEIKATLDDAEAQYAEGYTAYAAGAAQLAVAEEQLAEARTQREQAAANHLPTAQLDAIIAQLEATLAEQRPVLDATAEQLAASRAELDAGQAAYSAAVEELNAQREAAQQEIDNAWYRIYSGEVRLNQARADLEQGQRDYETGLDELEQAKRDGRQELDDAYAELVQGEQDYQDGLEELETKLADARKELDDGWAEVDDAQAKIAELEKGKLYLLQRSSVPDYIGYQQDSERMGALARVFPLLFFIVAALVCLTTMTRMVEEERTQIGVLKALGYSTAAITRKYLTYGLLAAAIGCVIGCVLGSFAIPAIICNCYGILYSYPSYVYPLHWGTCIGVAVASLGSTAAAVLWAIWTSVVRTPAELMRPRAPKAGKRILLERIGFLWKRMNFSMKVSARNLLRYQKRFWMTVIGVGGCTALVIAGFGLQEGILSVIDRQFGVIYQFDLQVTLNENSAEGRREETIRFVEDSDEVESHALSHFTSVTCDGGARAVEGYLLSTPDPETFATQYLLKDYRTGEELRLPDEGCVITQKLAELLDLSVGDRFVIDADARTEVQVAAICEQYVHHYIYFSDAAYVHAFGEEPGVDTIFLRLRSDDEAAVSDYSAKLLGLSGVTAATNLNAQGESFRDKMSVVNYAVFIIIFSAAALAFVVLYNLTNINITERIRELATLKVLGFYDMETAMYVYRENIVLTLLGIALGQLMGRYLSTFMVRTVEIDMVMFGRYATWTSYVWSIGLTLLFALLVNLVMFRRLQKIDMIESLKSVE